PSAVNRSYLFPITSSLDDGAILQHSSESDEESFADRLAFVSAPSLALSGRRADGYAPRSRFRSTAGAGGAAIGGHCVHAEDRDQSGPGQECGGRCATKAGTTACQQSLALRPGAL